VLNTYVDVLICALRQTDESFRRFGVTVRVSRVRIRVRVSVKIKVRVGMPTPG